MFSVKRIIYPFIIPTLFIVVAAMTIWQWSTLIEKVNEVEELRAFLAILPIMPYAIFLITITMGWRYNNAGLILASLFLAHSYFVFSRLGPFVPPEKGAPLSIQEATAFLLPLNVAVFCIMTKRRIFTSTGFLCVVLLLIEIIVVSLLCHWPGSRLGQLMNEIFPTLTEKLGEFSVRLGSAFHRYDFGLFENISTPSIFAFCVVLVFLLARFFYTHETIQAGFAATLVGAFLGMASSPPNPSNMIYFSAAGLILIISTIETSFSMAYVDDLTGLQSRRSLNATLTNLGRRYAIAMIDVDHFKQYNDTYGHKTGDHILKMIASKLQKMSGGAKTFRYGGEEFVAIFPGKSDEEALLHLEQYRQTVASTPFAVRGKRRRKGKQEKRGHIKTSGTNRVKVTVSIGIAGPGKYLTDPEKVLRAADRALYRAKNAGRNRVMGEEPT